MSRSKADSTDEYHIPMTHSPKTLLGVHEPLGGHLGISYNSLGMKRCTFACGTCLCSGVFHPKCMCTVSMWILVLLKCFCGELLSCVSGSKRGCYTE